MNRLTRVLLPSLLLHWQYVSGADYVNEVRPILATYCVTCHSTEKPKGDLDLERFTSLERVKREPAVWQHALEQIRDQEMPPKDSPRPSAQQMALLTRWMQDTLDQIALANAGDPGPVVLRRLSNREYTYTIRDLTGVATIDPASEFPVDGAAGEGFTNAGAALVMSPALLTKYLDAAKQIASHAVLLPDGIQFSPLTTSRDWTNERLRMLREFYAQFAAPDGRLPIGKYLDAMLQERSALTNKTKTTDDVARARGLSPKYLAALWGMLNDSKPSLLLDPIREKWRSGNLAAADIEAWQQSLWRFTNVGHLGKVGGPTSWMEPVSPLVPQHEFRLKLAAPADGSDVTIYLAAGDAGDGPDQDLLVWENARLVAPGRAEVPLKHVRAVWQQLARRRATVAATATKYLAAAHERETSTEPLDNARLSQKHGLEADLLAAWLTYLGLGSGASQPLGPLLTKKTASVANYNFIQGWTGDQAFSVLANSSDTTVQIPGRMKPMSIATHPSPKLASVLAWRSPVTASVQVTGRVQDAHTACGNGITWSLELRRGNTRERLASGASAADRVIQLGPIADLAVKTGDVLAIVIGPGKGDHTCDLTAVDLTIRDGQTEWDLAKDVAPDILAGNPHADRHGNQAVWHFFGDPESALGAPTIPAESSLAQWRRAKSATERQRLALQIQNMLQQDFSSLAAESPDRTTHAQLLSFNGPLLSASLQTLNLDDQEPLLSPYGLDRGAFGTHPQGGAVSANSLCVQAPSLLEVRLPAALVDGTDFIVQAKLAAPSGGEASVQAQVSTSKPTSIAGLRPSSFNAATLNGAWNSSNPSMTFSAPILVQPTGAARQRFEAAFSDFRQLFPTAVCYTKIVPIDEVVTLTLFHREDTHLARLMLDDTQKTTLDRLWGELHFVSQDALTLVDAFEQIWQYSTQDGPNAPHGDKRLEPLREPIMRGAEAFKKQLVAVEPLQVQAAIAFATQAWRRPLSAAERQELLALYQQLRNKELPHDDAVRTLLTRVLVAPAFLYRGEQSAPGFQAVPINDWELATRMSYFLWSSAPDDPLQTLAAQGTLHDPDVLVAQSRRMLGDAKVRRLATEFGCQWLHVRDLDTLDEKSERHFPTFVSLREAMQEETVRFFMDLFQANRSVLSLLDADASFMNGPLAKHYGITLPGDDWQRVDGLRAIGRGGILAFASTLAKQSGASRTSPILRGNWLSEVVLGEKLPRPPKGVPVLPEEAPQGLTERQLIEQHSSDAQCARCHRRIDPLGFALEGFDAIGRARSKDAAGMVIDTAAILPDGTRLQGLDGLRTYLLEKRRDDFLRQFCRKLLGYALGRSVQLSDQPLLETMLAQLKTNDHKIGIAIELILRSPQFREVRGREYLAGQE